MTTNKKTIFAAAFAGFIFAGPALAEDMMSGYDAFIESTLTQSDETVSHGHEDIVAGPRELETLLGIPISFDGQGHAHCLHQSTKTITPQRHGKVKVVVIGLCKVEAVGATGAEAADYYVQRGNAFRPGEIACQAISTEEAESQGTILGGGGAVYCHNEYFLPYSPVDMDTEKTRGDAHEYIKALWFIFKYMMEVEGLDVTAPALKSESEVEAVADATD